MTSKAEQIAQQGTDLACPGTFVPASYDQLIEEANRKRMKKFVGKMVELHERTQSMTIDRQRWIESRKIQIENLAGLEALLRHAFDNGKVTEELVLFVQQEQNNIANATTKNAAAGGKRDYIAEFFGAAS